MYWIIGGIIVVLLAVVGVCVAAEWVHQTDREKL